MTAIPAEAIPFASREVLTVEGRDPEPDEMRRPDGSPWRYAVTTDHGTIFAESATGIFGVLITNYADLPDTHDGAAEAYLKRLEFAQQLAQHAQSRVAQEAEAKGLWNADDADEDVLTTLFSPKSRPTDFIDLWAHPVPLVLVWTDYSPYTSHQAPRGNVWWIDPSDELTLLRSMHELDLITFLSSAS